MYIIVVVYYYPVHEDDRYRKRCILSKYKICRLYILIQKTRRTRGAAQVWKTVWIFLTIKCIYYIYILSHIFDHNQVYRFWYGNTAVWGEIELKWHALKNVTFGREFVNVPRCTYIGTYIINSNNMLYWNIKSSYWLECFAQYHYITLQHLHNLYLYDGMLVFGVFAFEDKSIYYHYNMCRRTSGGGSRTILISYESRYRR